MAQWLMPPSHLSGTACGSLRLRNATNRTKIIAVIAERSELRSAYLTFTGSLSFVSVALTEYATISVFRVTRVRYNYGSLRLVLNVTYELHFFAQYLRILTYDLHIFAYHLRISSRYWYFNISKAT